MLKDYPNESEFSLVEQWIKLESPAALDSLTIYRFENQLPIADKSSPLKLNGLESKGLFPKAPVASPVASASSSCESSFRT